VRTYPSPAFSLFALLAAVASVAAFVFMIALFATAYTRFQNAQVPVTWGAMVHMRFFSTKLSKR
jgi:hypothetical protein